MTLTKIFSLASIAAVLLSTACTSSVLSTRTDEQAWKEYQKELKLRRTPASVEVLDAGLEEIPLRKIIMSCTAAETAQSCYEAKLLLAFDEAFRQSQRKTPALSDVQYKKNRQHYLSSRSYAVVSAEVQNFHQILLSGMDLRAGDHVRDLNQECDSGSDANVTSYQPFNGGNSDLPKAYFACLNANWETDASQLLTETTERLGLTLVTAEAKEWIKQKQVYPVYEEMTRSILAQKVKSNFEAWSESAEGRLADLKYHVSLKEFVKNETPILRRQFPFLSVESILTDAWQKHQKSKKGSDAQ